MSNTIDHASAVRLVADDLMNRGQKVYVAWKPREGAPDIVVELPDGEFRTVKVGLAAERQGRSEAA
jgi:hypothetical protein